MNADTPNSSLRHGPELAIDADGVARRFGAQWVLRGVPLQVRAGEVVGVLGANGSGKTTLLRILCTLLKPSAGCARVCGYDVATSPGEVRQRVGFLAHVPGLYDDLTARENLRFAAQMRAVPATALDAMLGRVGLLPMADARVRGFSAGMQRRLALARLMLGRPRVLLLDEPYSNLDADGVAVVNDLIGEVCLGGGAALVVLHSTALAAHILDRTVSIVDGRIAGGIEAARGRGPVATAGSG